MKPPMPHAAPVEAAAEKHNHETRDEQLRHEIEKTRDKLIDRSVALTDYVDRSVRRTVDQTAQRAEQAVTHVTRAIEGTVHNVAQSIRDTSDHLAAKVNLAPVVRSSPVKAFAGAFAVGYVLSRLMARPSRSAPAAATEKVAKAASKVPAPTAASLALGPVVARLAMSAFAHWRDRHHASRHAPPTYH